MTKKYNDLASHDHFWNDVSQWAHHIKLHNYRQTGDFTATVVRHSETSL